MNQYNKNKTDGLGTWPEFEQGMHFYVPRDFILFDLKECSDYETGIESRSLLYDETDFLSGNNYMVSQILLCIRYDGTWSEILSGNSRQ